MATAVKPLLKVSLVLALIICWSLIASLSRFNGRENGGNKEEFKTILLWTKWYGLENGFNFGYGRDQFRQCPVNHCQTTANRQLLNQSQAVLFHTQADDLKIQDIPRNRSHDQRFVMYFFEPPTNSKRATFEALPSHFFNWTFTYRRDSDVPSNSYGDYRFKENSLERAVPARNRSEGSLEDFYGVNITAKTKMVAWFSSNCKAPSRREKLVAELGRYVQIDIYGRCGPFKCEPTSNHESEGCDQLLKNNYLFYLSFENSFCPDYVTEKLYRPLRSGLVPVVLGAASYSQFAPPHSYINALDYSTVQELADYLLHLARHRQLYAHYLEWRRHFQVVQEPIDGWCRLCQMLHDPSLPAKSYANIADWWFDQFPCLQNSLIDQLRRTFLSHFSPDR